MEKPRAHGEGVSGGLLTQSAFGLEEIEPKDFKPGRFRDLRDTLFSPFVLHGGSLSAERLMTCPKSHRYCWQSLTSGSQSLPSFPSIFPLCLPESWVDAGRKHLVPMEGGTGQVLDSRKSLGVSGTEKS